MGMKCFIIIKIKKLHREVIEEVLWSFRFPPFIMNNSPNDIGDNDKNKQVKSGTKRIFLIRHAESQNNVAKREAKDAWRRVKRFQGVPSWHEWYSISTLLLVPMNTDLSEEGEDMVAHLKERLHREDFLTKELIDLIVHSPLTRAKRTCHELFEHVVHWHRNNKKINGKSGDDDQGKNQYSFPIIPPF